MVDIMSPYIDPCRNVQTFKLRLQCPCVCLCFIFPCALTTADDDSAVTVLFYQRMVIRHVRQVVYRRIVIYIDIIVTLEEIACVEQTAQRQAAAEQIRSSQVEIHTVIAAHGCTCQHNLAIIRIRVCFCMDLVQTRHKFFADIFEPLFMPHDTTMMIAPRRAPCFFIHTTNAEQLQTAVFQMISDCFDHAAAFKVEKFTVLAGKYHHRQTRMTVYLKFHITVQVIGIFFVIISMHIA